MRNPENNPNDIEEAAKQILGRYQAMSARRTVLNFARKVVPQAGQESKVLGVGASRFSVGAYSDLYAGHSLRPVFPNTF